MAKSMKQTQREIEANDPPIEINSIWVAKHEGKVLRKLRILAPFPDPQMTQTERAWIFLEMPNDLALLRIERRSGVCPEFNLRHVFRLTKEEVEQE